jgi:hypothetical protein
VSAIRTSAQAPALSGAALKTPWGGPDLNSTRPRSVAKYAHQEFFTEAQRAELDRVRSDLLGRFATERDINGAYNAAMFFSTKHTGARTSKIVDPPDGRIPPLTPEARRRRPSNGNFFGYCSVSKSLVHKWDIAPAVAKELVLARGATLSGISANGPRRHFAPCLKNRKSGGGWSFLAGIK